MDLEFAREVLKAESEAIISLLERVDESFARAAQEILDCKGRVITSGMGKAGIIGRKISGTLASTGTRSLFLHPAEALHGDLGRVGPDDVVLILSNSGETQEILRLLPVLRKIGARIVSITGGADSPLGKASDVVLKLGKIEEACPLKLAPSASTAAMLALGDALALTVQKERKFDKEQYAFYHPAGELGRRLLKVSEVMRTGDRNPIVTPDVPVAEALKRITEGRAGAVCIVDGAGRLAGIFTDGDLRRNVDRLGEKIGGIMTKNPITVTPDQFATEAARLLKEKKIDEVPVVNDRGEPVGMLDVQDLLSVGLI
ncbi:MAG: KpsF/GutQ family sugar-phosphate isomerase [Planctomycetota bacterium]|jgi:arabinose-5-phosphate isomerase